MTREFPAQRASNAENVFIWWRHHEFGFVMLNAWNYMNHIRNIGCIFPTSKSTYWYEGFDVLFAQARVHCDNKSRQVGLNHDYNVTFSISPVNVSILRSKYEFRARSESRFACYYHCYVTWCPLTTGIVASQYPSSRDAAIVTRYLSA